MAKVFTSKQFIDRLKWLVNDVPNVYYSGKNWSKRNSKGQVQFDCVLSVKCILWNFRNNYKINDRGGTIYKSNGVPDFPCNAVYEICTDVGTKFDNLVPGEYLCMKGTKYNHTGIYLGNGKVFEDTTGWNTNRAIISDISKDGTRSYQGKKLLKWTYHGKLKYIDYSDEPQPTPTPTKDIYYQTYDNVKNKWLPKVKVGSNDYAGNLGNGQSGLRIEELEYRSHDKVKKKWLPWVKGDKDYAGNLGNDMDAIQIKGKTYRTYDNVKKKWLPWVSGTSDYAGNYGNSIGGVQIK